MPKGVPLEPGNARARRPRRGPSARVRDVRGRDPEGRSTAPARSRSGTRGTYELVEEKKDGGLTVRLHGKRLEGTLDARPGASRRQGAELAAHAQARRRAPRDAVAAKRAVRADVGDARRRSVPRGDDWLFEVKWDGYRAHRVRRAAARSRCAAARATTSPSGSPAVAKELPKALQDARLRGRRRGVRARRGGPRELLGDAAAQARRRRSSTTSSTCSRWTASRVVDLPLEERRERLETLLDRRNRDRPPLGGVRRRRGAVPRPRRSRGSRASSPSGATRATARPAHARLAQDQGHGRPGVRDRRLHEGPGAPRGKLRLARARRTGRASELVLRRQRRHRLRRRRDRAAAEAAASRWSARSRPSARCRRCRRCARATSSGSSRSSSPRWSSSSGRTTAGCARRSYKGLREDKTAEEVVPEAPTPIEPEIRKGKPRAEAVEPRQALLAGGGDHQGRPARVLPRRRAGARPASARPAVHDEALPRRLAGQVLLPEGRAEAHARLDRDAPRSRRRRASRRGSARSTSRS